MYCSHLLVPLATPKVGCTSGKQRKLYFSLVFRSVCTTFDFIECTLARK